MASEQSARSGLPATADSSFFPILAKDNPIVHKSAARREGFLGPNYTQIPNDIMDRWLAELSGAETKVLLYLARRTFGFHRDQVEIGLRKICDGVPGKDHGTGLHIETASKAVKGLEAKGIVVPKRKIGGRTTYALPVSEVYGKSEHPCSEIPNSPACGKSVHEERKSSSERNIEKDSLGPTVEQRQTQKLATAPRPRTNTENAPIKADDEQPKPNPHLRYASPEDELRNVYRTKTGLEMTPDLLSRLKEICELHGATLTQYVETLRPHMPNAWRNPAGFMTDFARKIQSKTPGGTPAMTQIDLRIKEVARCNECAGVGTKNGEYCNCQLGRELKRLEQHCACAADKAPNGNARNESLRRFNMKPVAIHARVSTNGQENENQLAEKRRFARGSSR